jgi:hypothetical protein
MGEPVILSGVCYVLFAYDIGLGVNLDEAARRIAGATEPETIRHKRRAPEHFEYRPPPLRTSLQDGPPLSIAGFEALPRVECVLFDFGAASITYAIPISGPLESLLPLSDALYENKGLLADSRARLERLMAAIAPAVDRPVVAGLVEDYAVYEFESVGCEGLPGPHPDAPALLEAHGATLARIMRAEPGPLSDQEIQDALSTILAYAPSEQVIIDWNAAIIIAGPATDADEARAVLEYANVELLELRRLDDQLDVVVDRSYATLSRRRWGGRLGLSAGRELRRVATLQMDSALLFEGVNNALKLIGDQYLARLYRLAAHRLHLPDWDASILRKLQTAESIYQKLSDRQTTLRMEVLEWIIIALIAFEVLMSFVRR